MMSIKKTKGFFISFLLGGAVGGALALLYAPKQGKLLRNDISRKTNELIEDGKKKTHDLWNGAEELAESTFDSANDFLNSGMEKIVRKSEKIKDAFKSGFSANNNESGTGNYESSSFMENAENPYTYR
jgi:gas vesicle protein